MIPKKIIHRIRMSVDAAQDQPERYDPDEDQDEQALTDFHGVCHHLHQF